MMIIIFMKCLYLLVYNLQFWVLYVNFNEEFVFICKVFIYYENICYLIFLYIVFCLQMDIQSVLFVLCFVCGDYFFCYRNCCNFYFKLFYRLVLKKKLFFLVWKKNVGISNWYFFFVDMNMFDDFDKKFVYRWVDCVFCYLLFGC